MAKHTLTYVRNQDKISKNGKPYTSCSIKVEKLGDQFINGFGNKVTQDWQPGDVVDVKIYEEEYMGKTYTKFEAPKPQDVMMAKIEALEARIAKLENGGFNSPSTPKASNFEKDVIETEQDFPNI